MAYELMDSCFFIPGVTTTACASWVQAWGSIGAIIGAFLIGRQQAQAARRLEADKRNVEAFVKLEIVHQLFLDAGAVSVELRRAVAESPTDEPLERELALAADLEQSLRALPIFDVPARGVALSVLEVARALADLRVAAAACDWIRSAGAPGSELPSRTRITLERAQARAVQVCTGANARCLAEIGHLRSVLRGMLPAAA